MMINIFTVKKCIFSEHTMISGGMQRYMGNSSSIANNANEDVISCTLTHKAVRTR